jgi:hypothetical protein
MLSVLYCYAECCVLIVLLSAVMLSVVFAECCVFIAILSVIMLSVFFLLHFYCYAEWHCAFMLVVLYSGKSIFKFISCFP